MTRATPVDCVEENSRMVPLIKVVKAAIVDKYEDINSAQQLYLHWSGRGFKKLSRELLRMGGKKVMLTINPSTRTATLPLDFEEESFVGMIDSRGQKIPFSINNKLADNCNYEEVTAVDKCTSCGQDKSICEELSVTEDITLVTINSSTYENSVIKKLYPNGDYYLETTTYMPSLDGGTVSAQTTKEFITNFGLKPCGCLETTTDNIANIRTNCYDTYCCHYAPCDNTCSYSGGYTIFSDTGLIQFDFNFPYSQVYLEYTGFLPKKNGQYMIPEVAFETLVEYIKWKSIANRKGVEKWRIDKAWDHYKIERDNMMKVKTRVSLSLIIDAARRGPKFNIDFGQTWYGCFSHITSDTTVVTSSSSGSSSSSSSTTVVINNGSYQLAVMTGSGVGHPVQGQSTYQNNLLKGSSDTEFLFLAKSTLSKINGDFTIDTVNGIIDISPSVFFDGDSLIIPYNKTT